jgi:ATP-binding protein involved in chromosome partitioning
VPVLGRIPIVQSICEAGDAGRPAVLQETTLQAKAFLEMSGNIVRQLAMMNVNPVETLTHA